jgi:Flp pilus assembly protein TadD
LDNLLISTPDYPPALLTAARLRARAGRAGEASVLYTRLLNSDPYNLEGLNDYGILLAGAGDYERAAALFRKALKVSPGLESARQNLSRLEKIKNK